MRTHVEALDGWVREATSLLGPRLSERFMSLLGGVFDCIALGEQANGGSVVELGVPYVAGLPMASGECVTPAGESEANGGGLRDGLQGIANNLFGVREQRPESAEPVRYDGPQWAQVIQDVEAQQASLMLAFTQLRKGFAVLADERDRLASELRESERARLCALKEAGDANDAARLATAKLEGREAVVADLDRSRLELTRLLDSARFTTAAALEEVERLEARLADSGARNMRCREQAEAEAVRFNAMLDAALNERDEARAASALGAAGERERLKASLRAIENEAAGIAPEPESRARIFKMARNALAGVILLAAIFAAGCGPAPTCASQRLAGYQCNPEEAGEVRCGAGELLRCEENAPTPQGGTFGTGFHWADLGGCR